MIPTLHIPDQTKQRIMEKLGAIPRPEFLCGRVTVSIEFNCRPDGSVGAVQFETHVREELLKRQ